jgi:hypothetical protein
MGMPEFNDSQLTFLWGNGQSAFFEEIETIEPILLKKAFSRQRGTDTFNFPLTGCSTAW